MCVYWVWFPFNRNEAQFGISLKRTPNQQKSTVKHSSSIHSTIEKATIAVKKKENSWIVDDNITRNGEIDKKDIRFKGGKRSLTSEKDKNTPRSVKVLRRSPTQNSTDPDSKTHSKLSNLNTFK